MKKFILSIVTLLVVTNFLGCSKSAPSCDSSDTKELILSIVIPKIKDAVIQAGLNYSGFTYDTFMNQYFPNGNIKDGIDEKSIKFFEKVREKAENIDNGTLIHIRTNNRDDELKKSECSADFSVDGFVETITYEIQLTSDGELYGTVY